VKRIRGQFDISVNLFFESGGSIMKRFIFMAKPVSVFIALTFFSVGIVYRSSAYASMVSTEQSLKEYKYPLKREELKNMLERKEIQEKLILWGVNPDNARAAVDSLTDDEILELVQKMDELPAGGNGVGVVIGAALIVFLVLLITDILGYTDIFPFVKKTK
jgi:hypothetical protein